MNVLVTDDEAQIRRLCERALTSAGYRVTLAESGEDAVRRLTSDLEIVLTDLTMPGAVNGIEVIRQVRRSGSADVILMTAFPELDTAVAALREGAYDYLVKPFTVDVLLTAVRRCADKRALSAELERERRLRRELQLAHDRLTQMEKVKELFGRFATPEIAQFMLEKPQDQWKRAERRTATVLFADVRRFTPFAERATPEETVNALEDVLACAIDAIHREGGVLNKFIGDGLLAIFGAPIPQERHAEAAARAALAIRDGAEALARRRAAQGRTPLRIGIGVSTGEMFAGCIGTKDRAEYTVIGHAVNVGARLQEAAEPGQILVSPQTGERLGAGFSLKPIQPVVLKGVASPLAALELAAMAGS